VAIEANAKPTQGILCTSSQGNCPKDYIPDICCFRTVTPITFTDDYVHGGTKTGLFFESL